MKKTATILIPYNFSRTSKTALDYAVKYVGNDEHLKILLVYVSDDQNVEMPEEVFKAIEEEYQSSLKNKIEWRSVRGELTESLIRIRKTEDIDFIIMGTFGTFSSENPSPTNTSKLVLEANCPVLVVPYGLENFKIKNIALVLGTEEIEDRKVLRTLLELARKFNAKVHVITIKNKPETYGYSEVDEKNENTLKYYLENFYSEHVYIENPDIVEGILSYASKKDIDIISILPRNHSKKTEPSEGQLTQMLTLHSKIPILAIEQSN